MALDNETKLQGGIVHHSDRGTQYCAAQYVDLLHKYGFQISMTQNGDPLDNSIAERVNGIIKQEFLDHYYLTGIRQARTIIKIVVYRYNNKRPHLSLNYKTPDVMHKSDNLKQDYHTIVNL